VKVDGTTNDTNTMKKLMILINNKSGMLKLFVSSFFKQKVWLLI